MSDEDESKLRSEELAEERTEKSEQRSEMAEERTSFAEDRTLLANERTFAGWAKASFAAIGLGLGFQALFRRELNRCGFPREWPHSSSFLESW